MSLASLRNYRAADVDEVPVEVRTRACHDAVQYLVGANAAHSLRRSNADKRRAVETLLADAELAAWSQEKIANSCGVSTDCVSKLVNDASINREEMRPATRKGTTYEQNTADIGKAKPAEALPATDIAASTPATVVPELDPARADTPKDTPTDHAGIDELATLR